MNMIARLSGRNTIVGASLLVAAGISLQGCGSSGPSPRPEPSPEPMPGPSPGPTSEPGPNLTTTNPLGPTPVTAQPTSTSLASTSTTSPAPPPTPCVNKPPRLDKPESVDGLNGVAYPQACYTLKDDGNHFFVIGDWGGMCGFGTQNVCGDYNNPSAPFPMLNLHNRAAVEGFDVPVDGVAAQQLVANNMDLLAGQTPPEFIVNVGDNFYPGGIAEHCDGLSANFDTSTIPSQFQTTFEDVYSGTNIKDLEWHSVLGNHDYGGVCVLMGWPQQIFYTWNELSTRWVMPAQYYSRQFRFAKGGSSDWSEEDVVVDVFFMDSNKWDSDGDQGHGICHQWGNNNIKPGPDYAPNADSFCTGFIEPTSCAGTSLWDSRQSCIDYFNALWNEQKDWLIDGLDKSTADWQFIVTHFPAPDFKDLIPIYETYGVDLIMCGHTHDQEVYYKDEYAGFDPGDTAWVISGGGGGVTSEGSPRADGEDDQYGFMDMTVTKNVLTIKSYSHGQKNGEPILRKTKEIPPLARAPARVQRPIEVVT